MNQEQRELLDKRILVLNGDVNGSMATYVADALMHLATQGNPDIQVIINSNGGDVQIGLHVFDMIDTYPGKTYGRVMGFARSMGAVILQACTTRAASEHAQILIHHITKSSVSLDTLRDASKTAKLCAGMEQSQEKLYTILAGRTKRSVADIIEKCASDTDMTAQEAKAFGLIGHIVESSPKED